MVGSSMVGSASEVLSANIRTLRARAGLSLSGLAREAGVSKATLSELESGAGNPTIETVFALARALHTPVSGLLRETPHARVRVVRAGETATGGTAAAGVLSGRGVDLRLLRREHAGLGGIEVYHQRFRSGSAQESAGHPGTEHTIVAAGRLAAVIDGRECRLGPGDSVEFDSSLSHSYIPRDGDVDSVLILTYAEPHGESAAPGCGAPPRDH